MTSIRDTFLVTGGLGFIGSHVVEDILQVSGENTKILILDFNRLSPNLPLFEHEPRVTILFDDITSPEDELFSSLSPFSSRVHTCVHLAAAISVEESVSDPQKYHQTNVGGSRTIFKWCADNKVSSVVSASSAAVYGTPKALPCREDDVSQSSEFLSPYAETKYKMELTARELVERESITDTSFVFLRFFNVFGPRQDPHNPYTGVISKFMDFVINGDDVCIFGDGLQTRDFVYVKDISSAIQRCAEKAQQGSLAPISVFNVCTGQQCTVNELAATCLRLPGALSERIVYRPARAGDIKFSYGDNTALVHEVGWDYESTLADGLGHTWMWFQSQQSEHGKGGEGKMETSTAVSARAGVGIK